MPHLLTSAVALLLACAGAAGARADDGGAAPIARDDDGAAATAPAATARPSIVRVSVLDAARSAGPLPFGARAPAIERAQRSDGTTAPIELAGGVPTVVNVWATWCPPCVREIPDLVKVAARHGGRVRFLGLASDSPHDDVVAATARLGISYDVLEIDARTAMQWNVSALPSTYIVDGAGVVRWSITGAVDASQLDAQLGPIVDGASLPGERVLAAGFAIRGDGIVVTTGDVVRQAERAELVAIGIDGQARTITGVLVDDERSGLAILKVDGALPPLQLAPPGAVIVDDAALVNGAPLLDAAGRVAAVRVGAASVTADALRALIAATDLDAPPARLGPDVQRNLVVSAVFFAVVGFSAFGLPAIVGAVRKRRRARPSSHHVS